MHFEFYKDQANNVRETKENVLILPNIYLLQQTFLETKHQFVEVCQSEYSQKQYAN